MGTDATSPPTEPIGQKSSKKTVVHIGGIPVEFPYQPYGTQLAFMARVISTLDRAVRDGHCHALLESPTGTGKSLSLLCSALAWQQSDRAKAFSLSRNSVPLNDPIHHGGGFIPEVEPSGMPLQTSAANDKNQKKKKTAPVIFYASRTHSQISQVIREYKKTTYRVPMAVLASRRHYCTNANIRGKDKIDEYCKTLLREREGGCSEFKNYNKVRAHPSLQKGGCYEVHDIEDLVNIGQTIKGCSYFAACAMAEDAQIVFCPYSYIVNPVVRRAMDVDIKGAIIILDEAHNIEDMARDSGSMDVEEDVLIQLQNELGLLVSIDSMTYQPLYEMAQDILSWISQRKKTLEKHEFNHYFSSWTGENALRELQDANISLQCFPLLQECAKKAIKVASEAEVEVAHLSGMSAMILEECAGGNWIQTVSLWCLNPAIVFRGIADLSLSVILTSGTLSPTMSFSSELGVKFGTSLEAPHVVDVESQLWAGIISNGPNNYPVNTSYKTSEGYAFQDTLGTSIEQLLNIVPGGVLIFFPSYKLMDKLCNRWSETGQWSQLNMRKTLFVEPRGGSQDDFDLVLKSYYNSIRGVASKRVTGRKRLGNKLTLSKQKTREGSEDLNKGAALLAVCRGKVSEGIDFSDENARMVIIVGIPFPNINDVQVAQKKKFNDTYKSSKNLLSGSEWYCHQAFRALNQAAGRSIRHRFDYGAVIFLDERFREERNQRYISKWIRKSVRQYDSFNESLEALKSFFSNVKERVSKDASLLQNSGTKTDIPDERKESNIEKLSKLSEPAKKAESKGMVLAIGEAALLQSSCSVTESAFPSTRTKSKVLEMVLNEKAKSSIAEYIVDNDIENDCGCSSIPSMICSNNGHEETIVKETPDVNAKNENSNSTKIGAFGHFPCQSLHPSIFPDSSFSPKSCLLAETPERHLNAKTDNLFEAQHSFNWSVNSKSRKRRMPLSSSLVSNLSTELFDDPNSTSQDFENFMMSSRSAIKEKHKADFEYGSSRRELKSQSAIVRNDNMFSSHHIGERLQIFCAICKKSLGHSESGYVTCLLTSSSKYHLIMLWREISETPVASISSIPVLVCDKSLITEQIWNRTSDGTSGNGVWCKQDGCVFNTVFCPFCSNPNNSLGVVVEAADASNIHLLDRIMFYKDRLVILCPEESTNKDLSPSSGSFYDRSAVRNFIEEFSYSPQHQNSGGWKTTKLKTQTAKRG